MMSNGNGLVFNGEGPVMSGTWYNPNNGDSFTVRDTYFENNQLIVLTTDGRQLDYNFIQNYVKSDKPIQKNKEIQNSTKSFTDDLPPEVKNLVGDTIDNDILPEDLDLINGTHNMTGLGNLNTPKNISKQEEPENVNFTIIEKALKDKSKPSILSTFEWKDIPEKEMHLLIDVLGITIDELVEWYTKLTDIKSVMGTVLGAMKDYIYNIIKPSVPEEKPISKKTKTSKK